VLADTTALIVAHRPSTVALADRVALLQDGRVTAVGTHSELLRTSAHYRHVISSLEAEEAVRTGRPRHRDGRGGAGMSVVGTQDEDRSVLTAESRAVRQVHAAVRIPHGTAQGADHAHRAGAGDLDRRAGGRPALIAYGLNSALPAVLEHGTGCRRSSWARRSS
jgi:ABC-type glutathione transport system ATPase component